MTNVNNTHTNNDLINSELEKMNSHVDNNLNNSSILEVLLILNIQIFKIVINLIWNI